MEKPHPDLRFTLRLIQDTFIQWSYGTKATGATGKNQFSGPSTAVSQLDDFYMQKYRLALTGKKRRIDKQMPDKWCFTFDSYPAHKDDTHHWFGPYDTEAIAVAEATVIVQSVLENNPFQAGGHSKDTVMEGYLKVYHQKYSEALHEYLAERRNKKIDSVLLYSI